MSFVVDASVSLSWCFADESTPLSESIFHRALLETVFVPSIWSIEMTNGLGLALRRKRLAKQDVDVALRQLARLPIQVEESGSLASLSPLLVLMERHGLTAYDASYLQLAERLNLQLATFDEKLATAARSAGIHVVAV